MAVSQLLIGQSPAFLAAIDLVARLAGFDVPVVVEGETGTGKELVARAIHYGSARSDRPFVPVNCGALPDSLLENELFGHERGAFTDARSESPGLVELAHRGTLFLDEVDALSPRAQVALLRFLQDQSYRPLGARTERRADVRIVSASNRPLDALADAGVFRGDLLFRLRVLTVCLPPLRARAGDVTLLTHHFVDHLNRRYPQAPKQVTAAFIRWAEAQTWPGNVRELENVVHRQYLLSPGPELLPASPPSERDAESVVSPVAQSYRAAKSAAIEAFDRAFLGELLRATRGNVTAAARRACKERRALGKLLRKYGLRPTRYKSA
jgi:two-component system, NtrC family, response regulator GlrR